MSLYTSKTIATPRALEHFAKASRFQKVELEETLNCIKAMRAEGCKVTTNGFLGIGGYHIFLIQGLKESDPDIFVIAHDKESGLGPLPFGAISNSEKCYPSVERIRSGDYSPLEEFTFIDPSQQNFC